MSISTPSNDLLKFFIDGFNYDGNFQVSTPSGNYFWYRKRKEISKLLIKNIKLFSNNELSTSESNQTKIFVDIGCGKGVDVFLLRNLFKDRGLSYEFWGLDGNPTDIEICNLKKDYYKVDNIKFILSDITETLPIKDNSVDILYCSEVIEHIMNPEAFLREIKRVVKPKGYFILTTPNEPNYFQKAYWVPNRDRRIYERQEYLKNNPKKVMTPEGKEICLYNHISCRTNRAWDKALRKIDFELVDSRRGAIFYGATSFHDNNFVLGLRLLFEGMLDLMPNWLTRNFSDQLIGLYTLKS